MVTIITFRSYPKGDDGNWRNDFFKDGRNSWVKPKDNCNCHRILEKVIGKIIFNEAGILEIVCFWSGMGPFSLVVTAWIVIRLINLI